MVSEINQRVATTGPSSPLTTEFVQPNDCSAWKLSSTLNTDDGTYTFFEAQVPADLPPSCLPPAWDDNPEATLTFSPAVCPASWTYYNIQYNPSGTTSAECCPSGFTPYYNPEITGLPNNCVDYLSTSITTTTAGVPSIIVSYDRRFRENINVRWQKEHVTSLTMSYTLPDLTSDMVVPTWVPGENIPDGSYDPLPPGHSSSIRGASGLTLAIGLGVGIPAFLILCCCGFWVRRRSKKRKAEGAGRRAVEVQK